LLTGTDVQSNEDVAIKFVSVLNFVELSRIEHVLVWLDHENIVFVGVLCRKV